MSKELEAFKNILEYPIGYEVVNIDCCVEDIVDGQDVDIVKQALTKQEEMKPKVKRYFELITKDIKGFLNVDELLEYRKLRIEIKEWSKLK